MYVYLKKLPPTTWKKNQQTFAPWLMRAFSRSNEVSASPVMDISIAGGLTIEKKKEKNEGKTDKI